eukprot:6212593-Pleurochrysis_carterae.AAC.1
MADAIAADDDFEEVLSFDDDAEAQHAERQVCSCASVSDKEEVCIFVIIFRVLNEKAAAVALEKVSKLRELNEAYPNAKVLLELLAERGMAVDGLVLDDEDASVLGSEVAVDQAFTIMSASCFKIPVVESFLHLMSYSEHPAMKETSWQEVLGLYKDLKQGRREAFDSLYAVARHFTPKDVAGFLVLRRVQSDDPTAQKALGLTSTSASSGASANDTHHMNTPHERTCPHTRLTGLARTYKVHMQLAPGINLQQVSCPHIPDVAWTHLAFVHPQLVATHSNCTN